MALRNAPERNIRQVNPPPERPIRTIMAAAQTARPASIAMMSERYSIRVHCQRARLYKKPATNA